MTTVEVVHLRLGWILPAKPIHATRADVAHEQPAQARAKHWPTRYVLAGTVVTECLHLVLSHPGEPVVQVGRTLPASATRWNRIAGIRSRLRPNL